MPVARAAAAGGADRSGSVAIAADSAPLARCIPIHRERDRAETHDALNHRARRGELGRRHGVAALRPDPLNAKVLPRHAGRRPLLNNAITTWNNVEAPLRASAPQWTIRRKTFQVNVLSLKAKLPGVDFRGPDCRRTT